MELETTMSPLRRWFTKLRRKTGSVYPRHKHTFMSRDGVIAPTGPPPSHTLFIPLVCECGALDIFPLSNYELTTPEFKQEFKAMMERTGLWWYERPRS